MAPALFTRMSRRPNRLTASAAARATPSRSPRSAATVSTRPPVPASISRAVRARASGTRAPIITRAPSPAHAPGAPRSQGHGLLPAAANALGEDLQIHPPEASAQEPRAAVVEEEPGAI